MAFSTALNVITDAAQITEDTADDALVLVKPAAVFTAHKESTLYQYRQSGVGPVSARISGRVVYKLGDLRAYNRARFEATKAGRGW